jgi:hypothetical protein
VPYKQLISIVTSRGKFLSTIHMRIHGFTDSESVMRNDGEVEGVRTQFAEKFTIFIEDVIENRYSERFEMTPQNEYSEMAIGLDAAKTMIQKNDKKFVWLGFEPVVEVAATLGVPKESISTLNMSAITDVAREELQMYEGCVFICYDGLTSNHLVKHLKKEHDITAYNLNNGILHAARAALEKFI